MFTSFHYSELLRTPRITFQRYYPDVFMAAAVQNPRRLSFLVVLLIPEEVKGGLKQIIGTFFILVKKVVWALRYGIYNKKKVVKAETWDRV